MRIQVKDFMSSPVVIATEKTSVGEIRKLMKSKNINAIPIVEYVKQLPEAEVVIKGILTSSDINNSTKDKVKAADIMTRKIHVIHKDSSAQVAAKMMIRHDVHHLVSMEDGKIIGMVSSTDFVKIVADHNIN